MKALIIGGGIAGTVTAMALHKAGHEAELFEAYDRTAEGVGAFLTLAVNGIDTLGALGLKDLVNDIGFATPGMTLSLGNGRELASFPLGVALADGTVSQTVKRSDLYVALRDEAARRGIVTHYGKRLTDAVNVGDGVRAQFEDGTEAEGGLLIGADGLRSRVREIIDANAPEPRYVRLLNTGGYAEGVRVDDEPGVMRMIFGKRVFFAYVPHPNGQVWWFANPAHQSEPTAADLRALAGDSWRAEMLRLVEPDNSPATEIINATSEIYPPWSTYDFPTVPIWHRGRMLIVGDAAHATSPASGQGASMAIEDAVTLGRCLRDLDVPSALRAYESLRRERVEAVVAQGKRNGDDKAVGPVGRLIRDFFIKQAFKKPAPDRSWMWDHRIEWNERVAV
ncbi:FAD-dependent monooxygenase [Amycolatopsis sp. NPDC059657]|uniref:FAD-dependent monooxygenase n=1 Tax=Amycolatopsis sp. NPDC059657 TaxID=3346899 RepID=UPI00366E8612